MDELGEADDFGDDVDGLGRSIDGARAMVAAFDAEMRKMRSSTSETGREVASLSRGLARGLKRSFEGLAFDGMKLSDALGNVARTMADTALNAAVKPVTAHLGQALSSGVQGVLGGMVPFAQGGSFAQGRVIPFAKGGVVSQATAFPMRGGTGLMGEAGPEAIMPLTRGADGRLGVETAGGGRPVNVTMNIQTQDVDGFRRSESQIAARMSRAIARGSRNR